ncbi:SDR family NAD(P)-dependent oxidoreductase [Microbacterium sp. GXF0217]
MSTLHVPHAADGRRVVILGGTGRVGEGIVREWLTAGAEVIVPSRTTSSAEQLRSLVADAQADERLHTVIGDYTGFDSASVMSERVIAAHGRVTDVIASIGGWWQAGPTWAVTEADWQRYFVDLTTAHFANIRAWLPALDESGSYQLVLGGSAYTPVPGASIISMEQAALLMMHRVLVAEAGPQRRVFAFTLGPVITRGRGSVDPTWVSNADVGRVSIAHAVSSAPSAHTDLHSAADAADRIAAVTATGSEGDRA